MLNLFYSHNAEIENAYIITIKDNKISEKLSERCQDSCIKVGMLFKIWHAYDGTGKNIIEPDHLKDDTVMSMLKITNHYLTKSQVSCMLSHISLWLHCIKLDKPIIILEHDAIIVKKIQYLPSYNAIVYLGGAEWASNNFKICDIPLHGSDGPNVRFICRAHAYAVDPQVAKNLVAHVLKMGIYTSADCFMRADLFNITHKGLNAFDISGESTIRESESNTHIRNDDLKN